MLLTVKELAQQSHIKPATLYAWAAQGKMPYRKIHGLVRFDQHDIDYWLATFSSRTVVPPRIPSSRSDDANLDRLIARAKRQVYTPACEKPDEIRAKQGG